MATVTFQELMSSGHLEIGDGYRAKHSELGGTGLIFLRAGHLADTGFDFDNVERFREDLAASLQGKIAEAGDTVVTTKGNSTGRVGYVEADFPRFVYSPHLSYWRSKKPNVVAPEFLRYWSRGCEFRDQLEAMKTSTDMAPYLSLTDQRRLRITLPKPHVQVGIGTALSALDERIKQNISVNRSLEALASALFQSWFVDFDPVAAKRDGRRPIGAPAGASALFPRHFEESELGPIPQGWRIVPFDSVADFLNGLALQRYPARAHDELPVIKIAQLRAGTSVGADRCGGVPPEYVIDDGDVVFSWSGSLMIDVWCGGKGALNQHLFKVTSNEVPKWFYLAWLNEHLPEFQRIAADKATTMGHIRRFHLTEAKVLVPPEPLMEAITSVQQPLLDQIIHNRLESRTLAELRDTLLGPLLSGELTIKSAENTVGAAL